MLINIELQRALRVAGVDDETAAAASVIIADQERRLARLEFIARVATRGLAAIGLLLLLQLTIVAVRF